MLSLYLDEHEIMLLARDSELLYDLARLILKDNPEALARVHLLNISRTNMRADHITEYLAQEGIYEKVLKSGKKFVFGDTGFAGTIPQTIKEYFPMKYHAQLKTHLMCSARPEYPSTRVFLTSMNPAAPSLNPGSMHASIIDYEHLGRYTGRSDRFAKVNGKLVPISRIATENFGNDGAISKQMAVQFMEDLAAYVQQPEVQELIKTRTAQYDRLKKLYKQPQKTAFISHVQKMLNENRQDPYIESMIRDFLEIQERNLHPGTPPQVPLESVGLKPITSTLLSNKATVIDKYPEWKTILQDPETHIKDLVHKGDFSTLGAISDTLYDHEFNVILAQELGAHEPTPKLESFIKALIDKDDPEIQEELAKKAFSGPHLQKMEKSLSYFVEHGSSEALSLLPYSGFSKEESKGFKDLLMQLVQRENEYLRTSVIENVLTKPHSAAFKEVAEFLAKNGTSHQRSKLAAEVLGLEHAGEWTDLIQILYDTGDDDVRSSLVPAVKSIKDPELQRSWIQKLIENGGPETRRSAVYFFSNEEIGRRAKDLLRKLIDVADTETSRAIARYILSKPHIYEDRELLWYALDHANGKTLEAFDTYTHGEIFDRWNDRQRKEGELFTEALKIKDLEKRKAFRNKYLKEFQSTTTSPSPAEDKAIQPKKAKSTPRKREFTRPRPDMKPGDFVKTPAGKSLEIESYVDEGKRGVVYKVKDRSTGEISALKVAHANDVEALESIAKEEKKVSVLKAVGLPHASIREQGDNFVLKEWIDGTRADAWIREWSDAGSPSSDAALKKLRALLKDSAKKKAYVGDLNPKNLIWTGEKWVIIDSGSVRRDLAVDQIMNRYEQKISSRWRVGPASCPQLIKKLFSSSK